MKLNAYQAYYVRSLMYLLDQLGILGRRWTEIDVTTTNDGRLSDGNALVIYKWRKR